MNNELQALQNFCTSINFNLTVYEYMEFDKRKSITKYYLRYKDGASISPKLDYNQMNHFLLGFMRCKKLLQENELLSEHL